MFIKQKIIRFQKIQKKNDISANIEINDTSAMYGLGPTLGQNKFNRKKVFGKIYDQ